VAIFAAVALMAWGKEGTIGEAVNQLVGFLWAVCWKNEALVAARLA
jgi:hypothetical protein